VARRREREVVERESTTIALEEMSGVEVRQMESEESTVCILSLACKHAQMQNYTHEIEPNYVSFSR
jgi:hypothetical protein